MRIGVGDFFRSGGRYDTARLLRVRNDKNAFTALFMVYWGDPSVEVPRLGGKIGVDNYEDWLLFIIENYLYIRPDIKMSIGNQRRIANELGYSTRCYTIPKFLDPALMEEIHLGNLVRGYFIGDKWIEPRFGLLSDKEQQEYKGLEGIIDLKGYEMVVRAVRY